MRFTADGVDNGRGPMAVSPHRNRAGENERSLLQVPTLTSREIADGALPPHKRARYDGPAGPMHWAYDSPATWGGQFLSEAPHMYGMRAQYPASTFGADPRMPALRRSSTPESLPSMQQYSPPQVRSGRGAMRIASNRATGSPSTTPVVRQGISVSNRGKGPRKPAACRNNLSGSPATVAPKREGAASPTTATTKDGQPAATPDLSSEAERIGFSVQAVAIAISRKTKRKLPMAAKKTEESPKSVEPAPATATATEEQVTTTSEAKEAEATPAADNEKN